jgi:Cd2+/Zn2+-exporting ATPase
VLLTGDHERTARAVAAELGLEHRAGLLPEEKVSAVRALVAEYGQAAMVGDGVNDAPALAAASVGIAMGTAGADVALETADIAIMGDDPRRVAYVLELGRKTGAVIRQNITFSLLTKAVAVGLVFPGYLTLWLAVVADTGTALLVTLNAMRLLGRPGGGKDGGAQGE